MQRQYSIKLYSIYKNTIPKMSFIQHDTEVNRITFEMYNDINEPMTDISYATATVRRSDNKTYTYGSEDFIIEGNLVTFILPPSAVYLAGECVASVSVYDGNMGRLSTETFKYTVKEELIADTPIDETNEYPILTDLLERVENVPNTIAEIETLKESMQVTKEEILDLQDTLEQAEYVRQAVYDGGEVIVDKAYVSQLNDIVSQIDFLKLLKDHNEVADKLYIKKISNKTFDVCIPFRGNKVARYSIGLQVGSDDYIKMLGVSVCELKADSASSYSKDLDSKTGTWVTVNNQNWYASAVGATFTTQFTGTGVILNFLSDNRGGMWSVSVDGGTPVLVSTYSSVSVQDNSKEIASGLVDGNHTMVATFTGDDPSNLPSGGAGTSRGWVKHTAVGYETKYTVTVLDVSNIITPVKIFDVMPTLSNTEYAINATIYGTNYTKQFFPQHNGIKTVFAVEQKIYFDNELVTDWTPNIELQEVKSVKVIQNMLGKHPDDVANPLLEIRTIHTFNANGVSVKVKIKFLRKASLGGSFGMMFPICNTFGKQLITSFGNRYDSIKTDGSTDDLIAEGDIARSFAFINTDGVLGEKDIIMAVNVDDVPRTYRKGKVGQRTPLLSLKHTNTTYQKLYPYVYEINSIAEVGEIYEGSFTFGLGELPMASDMLP